MALILAVPVAAAQGGPGPDVLPDLVAESLSITPGTPTDSENVTINATFANRGVTSVSSAFVVFTVDGETVAWAYHFDSLDPGETFTTEQHWIALPGDHALVATIDPNDYYDELDESNNNLSIPFHVTLGNGTADLTIFNAGVYPSAGGAYLYGEMANVGNASATSTLRFKVDGAEVASWQLALAGGTSATRTHGMALPDGPHVFEVIADADGQVNETNESNNTRVISFSTGRPDLVPTSLTLNATAFVNTTVGVTATVRNEGVENASFAFRMTLFDNNVSVGSQEVPYGLNVNQTATRTFNWTPNASGSHTLRIYVDTTNAVNESNESNNNRTLAVDVAATPAPDLVVSSFSYTPANPTMDDVVQISTNVRNAGTANAGAFAIALRIGGVEQARWNVSGLVPNETVARTYNFTPPFAGTFSLRADADVNATVAESNESNNAAFANVTVRPALRADLVFTSMSINATPQVGIPVRVNATVRNNGTGNATSFTVALQENGTEIGRFNVSSLASNASVATTFDWTPTITGPRTLRAIADVDNTVNESNETNNTRTMNVTVSPAPLPDLVVSSVQVEGTPVAGFPTNVTVFIRNIGGGHAGPSQAALWAGGEEIGRQSVPYVQSNTTIQRSFSWTPSSAGPITLTGFADVDQEIAESNESNNTRAQNVTVAAPNVNLVALELTASRAQGPVGAGTELTGKFRNTGNVTSPGFYVELTVGNESVALRYVPSLAPGQNATISGTWNFTLGTSIARLVVDADSRVVETNESDNTRTKTLVGLPIVDLGVDVVSVEHEPLSTEAGDLPHPYPRHIVRMVVSNEGAYGVTARLNLSAFAHLRIQGFPTNDTIVSSQLFMPAGASRVLEYVWEPINAVGDVELVATLSATDVVETDPSDNEDRYDDFVIVGGLGGAVVGVP